MQSLTVHWGTSDTSSIDGWEINYPQPNQVPTPPPHDVPTSAIPLTGVTLTGLEHNTTYHISVRAYTTDAHGNRTYKPSSSTIEATTLPAVKLVALEVTQGLQNWNRDIDLVRRRRTVVRAFLEPVDGSSSEVEVNVRLYAVRDGAVQADAELPVNRIGGPPSVPNRDAYIAEEDAADNRANLNSSANFLVGVGAERNDWVGSAVGQLSQAQLGTDYSITYRLVVDEGVICAAAAAQPDDSVNPDTACKADLEFRFVKTPTVRLVGVPPGPATPIDIEAPTVAELEEQAERIKSLMPIPDLDAEIQVLERDDSHTAPTMPATDPTGILFTIQELLWARLNDSSPRVYLGVLSGGMDLGGQANQILSNVAVWHVGAASAENAPGYARNRGAHEFGHVIGGRHALHEDYTRVCGDPLRPEPAGPVYRYIEEVDGSEVALLGELNVGRDERVWGLDTRFVDQGSPDWLAVLNPDEVYALMSYCDREAGDPPSQVRWIDQQYHGDFIGFINGIDWSRGPAPGEMPATVDPGATGYLYFRGVATVAADGSGVVATVLPVFETGPLAVLPPGGSSSGGGSSGRYVLELLGADMSSVLRTVRFDAWTPIADISEGGGPAADAEMWIAAVSDPRDYGGYRISRSDDSGAAVTVARAARSASAPTVSVTAPVAGQTINGGFDVSWSGADADADTLTYWVEYSRDGGRTYQTVAASYSATTLTVDSGQLAGSSTAVFRVSASDGLRSASATSGVFTLANSAPRVHIHAPAHGAIRAGLATMVLHASAHDPEDGPMDPGTITWSSDIDGPMAAGGLAVVRADGLTEGAHTLTASVTDSANNTATATVTVTIKHTSEVPAPVDDIAHGRPGASFVIDVAANDTDPEDDINPNTVRIVVPPSTAAAAAQGGNITYRSDTAGYDELVYEICDRARGCARAHLTIITTSWP